ncbi:hypothetical protein GGR56DRAFT_652271 [Xylariaceae sp. FL0804]|nr:hypothetical protein GGR56DRAFT_652271 [Xylariaceae sp. FL0804]
MDRSGRAWEKKLIRALEFLFLFFFLIYTIPAQGWKHGCRAASARNTRAAKHSTAEQSRGKHDKGMPGKAAARSTTLRNYRSQRASYRLPIRSGSGIR